MKHTKLFKNIALAAVCFLGVSALIGGSVIANHDFAKAEAAYPAANCKIGAKTYNDTATYTSADAEAGETVYGTATFTRGNDVTITFDNFTYSGPGGEASSEYDRAAFYLSCKDDQNVIVNLIGDNYINLTGDDSTHYGYGLFFNNTNINATTTFQGGGSLTVTFSGYNKSSECIYVKSRAVINDNITIYATAGKAKTPGDVYGESFGLTVESMTMNSGTLNLRGGPSDSDSLGTTSSGLYIDSYLETSYFNGGTINAYSAAAADDPVTPASTSSGILLGYANAIFRGTEIYASSSAAYTGKCAGIYVTAYSESPSTITFEGGEVVVSGIGGNAANSYGFGFDDDYSSIVVEKEAKLTVIGSTKTFEKAAVINKIKGEGWNNTSGSGDSEYILKSNVKRAVNYKKAYFEIAPGVIEQAPTAVENLGETGEPLVLVNAGLSSTGTMQYKVGSGEWSADLPTAIEQGNYTVYYRSISNDGIHEDVIDDSTQKLIVTIGKPGAPYKVTPTAKTDLVANGSAQALVNAGSSDYGTVVYRLNETGEFSETIPSGTDAGTYTVEFKILSNSEDYGDSPVTKVQVTIATSPAPVPPEPGPEPTPVDPTDNNGGFPGWAIALIAVGGTLGLGCLFLVALFFFNPRYVVDYTAKKVIRTIYVKRHDGLVLLRDTRLRKIRRNEVDVFKTKEEAEKALNK